MSASNPQCTSFYSPHLAHGAVGAYIKLSFINGCIQGRIEACLRATLSAQVSTPHISPTAQSE
eukprot:1051612-Amphidinium_carterae.1